MRVKNATFVQKHLEKLVLLAAVLFLLLVLAIFLGGVINPYKVELGSSEYDQPADVIPALLEKSRNIEQGLQAPDPIDPTYVPPNMQDNYDSMMNKPIIDTAQSALPRRLSQRGTPLADLNVTPPPMAEYVVPSPPMPTSVAMEHRHAVLDLEFDPRLNPAYAALWDGQMRQPPDFYYVLMEGEFSMYDWVQALIGEAGEAGKIPSGIWSSRLNITAVYLIREELDEATGEWGSRTLVSPLPGQIQLMPSESHSADLDQAALLIQEIGEQQNQQDITQPVLPALANDDYITLPKDALFEDEQAAPGFGEDPFLEDGPGGQPMTEAERRRAERRQRDEERRAEREARRNSGRDSGPGGFEEGPGSANPGSSRNDRDLERQRELEERRQRQLEEERRRQEALERERQRREEERRRREEERRLANPAGGGAELGFAIPGGGNINPEQLTRVWAMDITAQYGKTYRYKLAVAVINPLYGVPRLADDQYEANKNTAALGPSEEIIAEVEWSEPVVVPPKYEFFFVGGGENRSRLEVWTMYNGLRIRQEFEVSAGDRIGGEVLRDVPGLGETLVEMNIGATVVDVERRQDINGRTVYALIYIDEQGELHERLQSEDQSNPRRRELDLDLREQEQELEDRLRFQDDFNDGGFGPGAPAPAPAPRR